MLVYVSDKNYEVHIEQDNDGYWVIVQNELGEHEDINIGFDDEKDMWFCDYIYNGYSCFHPDDYIKEHLKNDSDRSIVLHVSTTAFEIDRALREAYEATKNLKS